MEGSKLNHSEVKVEDFDHHKHVRIPIRRFRSPKLILAPRVRPKKTSSTSTAKEDQRLVIDAFPCHEVFMFLNQQFLGALQVEYQNKAKSPFEAHPIPMWTFLTCICFYSVVFAFKMHLKARNGYLAFILKHILLVSGSLSSASLLCIFQPHQHFWFLYVIIGLYAPVMLACHLLKNQVFKFVGTTMTSACQLRQNLNLFCGCMRK
ncbi:hypothetical protein Fmac_012020 [Flemingia macrophylla]|uniref:Uncharacterized protein n=1 Tax=Flemingia macrophylla TaxID=520843 RepID=A0ABD1MP32_9FABA